MQVKPLDDSLKKYLVRYRLEKKFAKQLALFLVNPKHPSLNTEKLEPKEHKIYSFRIDRKYRASFIIIEPNVIEIVDINLHYQ